MILWSRLRIPRPYYFLVHMDYKKRTNRFTSCRLPTETLTEHQPSPSLILLCKHLCTPVRALRMHLLKKGVVVSQAPQVPLYFLFSRLLPRNLATSTGASFVKKGTSHRRLCRAILPLKDSDSKPLIYYHFVVNSFLGLWSWHQVNLHNQT